jgi:hypothetical protein
MANKFSRVGDADKSKAALIEAVTGGVGKKTGRPKTTEEPTRKFNANIPESLYDAFKAKSAKSGHTMTWLILDYMQRYVDEE